MGGSQLVEGFSRHEITAHMDLIGYTPAERRIAWGYLSDLEREYRDIRTAAQKKDKPGQDRRIIRDL